MSTQHKYTTHASITHHSLQSTNFSWILATGIVFNTQINAIIFSFWYKTLHLPIHTMEPCKQVWHKWPWLWLAKFPTSEVENHQCSVFTSYRYDTLLSFAYPQDKSANSFEFQTSVLPFSVHSASWGWSWCLISSQTNLNVSVLWFCIETTATQSELCVAKCPAFWSAI